MAGLYSDDHQKLFITQPHTSFYVNPLYGKEATTDSELSRSLRKIIADFDEESKRLHEEWRWNLEEGWKVTELKGNLPKLQTPQPKSEVLMEDSKKRHAITSPRTLKQFCKSQNVTEMPTVAMNEGQTMLGLESNPMSTPRGHESQLQRAAQSQRRCVALEVTSSSLLPDHSKSAKTDSNSHPTLGRHKSIQLQTCQPFVNQGPSDGRQQLDVATQKPTLWSVSVHKSDKVSTSSISTSFETNKHIPSALFEKCSRRSCFLNGRSPSKFNYGQWLKVKYPFKVVSLKRGVISSLGGQPSQNKQQRLQDLIADEVPKVTKKEATRHGLLQPITNPSIQPMLPQQKHVCKPSPPHQLAESLPKATQETCRPPCCPTCCRPYSKDNNSFQSGFHKKFLDFPCKRKDNIGGSIRNTMPSYLPTRRMRRRSNDVYRTSKKEQKQQSHVSHKRHGGHDPAFKHGGMCRCCLCGQNQFRHGHHINLVTHPEFPTQNPRTLRRRLQKKRAKERQRHAVAEVHVSQRQQPPRRQRFVWVEKRKLDAASEEGNHSLVNAIASTRTSAKHVSLKSNDSKTAKEFNVGSITISLGKSSVELPSSIPNLPFVFTRKQDVASNSKEAAKNKAKMSAKENKGRDHKKDAATFIPIRKGMLPPAKGMLPRRHAANNVKPLQTHNVLVEGTYWLQNLDGSLHLTKINGLPFQPCCPSVCKSCSRSKWK